MLRVVFGYRMADQVNMQKLRESINMFSVNQMNCYHVLLESHNVVINASSQRIQDKWMPKEEKPYCTRSVTNQNVLVPNKPKKKCLGFSYYGAKLYNKLPLEIRETNSPTTFKAKMKSWIWTHIPSY